MRLDFYGLFTFDVVVFPTWKPSLKDLISNPKIIIINDLKCRNSKKNAERKKKKEKEEEEEMEMQLKQDQAAV